MESSSSLGLAFDDDFNLEDALVDTPTKPPAPKPKPAGGPSGGSKDLDLFDFFDTPEDRKTTTTKAPNLTTMKAPKRKPQPANPNDFDLADALDDKNDRKKDNNGGLAFDDDFNLEDALVDTPTKPPAPKPKPAGGPSGGSKDLDLSDFFDTPEDRKTTTTKAPKLTTMKAPKRKPQPKPQPANPNDFDLADALDDKNDRKKDNNGGGGSISDKDLEDILDDGYSPDRKKGGGGGGGGNVPSDDPGYAVPDDRSYFTRCGPGLTPPPH